MTTGDLFFKIEKSQINAPIRILKAQWSVAEWEPLRSRIIKVGFEIPQHFKTPRPLVKFDTKASFLEMQEWCKESEIEIIVDHAHFEFLFRTVADRDAFVLRWQT